MDNSIIACWVVTKTSRSLYRRSFGPFDTKDDAWNWVNTKDLYRNFEWSVWAMEKLNAY